MSGSIHNTQVNLDGLLEVLGKNLYSSPSVALRELIQNSHDACERYRIETERNKGFFIKLETQPDNGLLTITDNGSGLTKAEVQDYLATIGSGYTRVLRQSTQSEEMIGYFGLGFLSAYVIADKVEVITRSYQDPSKVWYFTSVGGKTFTIAEYQNALPEDFPDSGTHIKLSIAENYSALLNPQVLTSLVEKYCCLLPIDIFIDDEDKPSNSYQAPWHLADDISAIQLRKKQIEFAQLFEASFEPICCIPIPENNPYQLSGLLWIQDGSTYSSSDNRNVSVFCRNMFITDENYELLPRWAGFVGAVLESSQFLPTASREGLQKNDYYYAVLEFIRESLVQGLQELVLKEPESWRRVLNRHNQSLLGAAIADDRLFLSTYKSLKVPTTQGDMALGQLLRHTNQQIYIKNDVQGGYEEILFKARQIPLVLGYLYAASAFSQKYADIQGISCHYLGHENSEAQIFPRVTNVDSDIPSCLQDLFAGDEEELILTRFDPAEIPLVVIEDLELKLKQKIEDDAADKRIASAALSLARLHTKTIVKEKLRRIYVNLNHPIIERMGNFTPVKQQLLATILRSFMESQQPVENDSGAEQNQIIDFNNALIQLAEGE